MLRSIIVTAAVVVVAAGGCGFGSEAAFIDKASLSDCLDEIPVCNTTAGCKLVEEESYLEGNFPASASSSCPPRVRP
jgi:hypothetical protein